MLFQFVDFGTNVGSAQPIEEYVVHAWGETRVAIAVQVVSSRALLARAAEKIPAHERQSQRQSWILTGEMVVVVIPTNSTNYNDSFMYRRIEYGIHEEFAVYL